MFDTIIAEVVKTAGALAASGAVALIAFLLKKMHIDLQVQDAERIDYYAKQVVVQVEEVAASRIKAKMDSMTGPQKLSLAISALTDKMPKLSRNEAAAAIHVALPAAGLGASSCPEVCDTK